MNTRLKQVQLNNLVLFNNEQPLQKIHFLVDGISTKRMDFPKNKNSIDVINWLLSIQII